MRKLKSFKKISKGVISLLLAFLVMTNLGVPINFKVFAAEEEAATGSDIYALVYDIRPRENDSNWNNYELVIQRGNTPDPDVTVTDAASGLKRRVFKQVFPYSQFGASSLSMSNDEVKARIPWYSNTPNSLWGNTYNNSGTKLAQLFKKITIKDKVKPESIAGWFFYCEYATEINNLENIDTSICTDMRFAFYNVSKVKKLDLHTFDTSNVEKIDNFIYSYDALEEVDVSGFDLKKVSALSYFIKGGYYDDKKAEYKICNLNKLNISGMDISKIRDIRYFLIYTKDLEEITFDLNPRSALDFCYNFQYNFGLKKFTFGSEGHPFQPGIDVPAVMPGYGSDNQDTRRMRLNGMFLNCTALEEVDFHYMELPDYLNYPSLLVPGKPAVDAISYSRYYEYESMFKGCKNLTDLDYIENLFIESGGYSSWTHRFMFDGCESLETLDLSKIHAYIGGAGIFRNCKSLKTLNLSNLGTGLNINNWSISNVLTFQAADNNIYEGCTELSEIYLSPYYPPAANTKFYAEGNVIGCGNSIAPVDREWVKVELPEAYPDSYKYNTRQNTGSIKPLNEIAKPYPVGDPNSQKSTEALFTEFQPELAGRWVAVSKLNLRGNGGAPATQQIKGAIGMTVDYEDGEITEPARNGYHFTGWYSDKHDGEGTQLQKGQPAASWSYYAHWAENHYTLKLNGNGGTTAAVETETAGEYKTSDGKTVTETTGTGEDIKAVEYIANGNLGYDEYYELSSRMFTRGGYVLTGWNTRSNGEGEEYTANDSVNRLSSAEGGEATLYAQWHKPDLILKFDSRGGTAVSDRNYTLSNDPENKTKYGELAESAKEGYTFLGWFTKADDSGTQVTADTEVDGNNNPLYAHWAKNPTIKFDSNGYNENNQPVAYFNYDSTLHVLPRVYKYRQNLGTLPTPEYGSAVLEGWYTDKTGGTAVTPSTLAEVDGTTYYAHWGYRPKFETNGGNYTDFPDYAIQDTASYTIETLPTVTKENCTFKGWYLEGEPDTNPLSNGATVDLSSGKIIEARWTPNTYVEVTLDANTGSLGNAVNPIKVYKNTKIGALPVPTKDGYDFMGWYTDTQGEGTKYTADSTVGEQPVTLHAVWAERKYTVTFDAGDGTLYDSADAARKVRENGKITDLPGANRSNYILEGWYTDVSVPGTKLTAATAITGDADYHAKWVKNDNIESYDGLYEYGVSWSTLSNDYAANFGDNIIIAPQNGNNPLSATLSVVFKFNEKYEGTTRKTLPANSVKILIPKKVFFKDENGALVGIGTDNITAGLSKTDRSDTDFLYSDSDPDYPDYYVITNNDPITKTQTQSFDISYTVSASQLRSIKGGYTDENGYFCGEYYHKSFPVTITVDRDKQGIDTSAGDTDYTKPLNIEVHTDVKTTTALKTQWKASFDWDNSWGSRPDDADQYFYITWKLTSSHDMSSSQMFKINWNENTIHDGTVVKIYPEKDSYANWLEHGTFTYVLVTKHTRRPEDSGWKTVKNEAILEVENLSGHKEQFRAACNDAGVYLLPDAPFHFDKFISGYTVGTGDTFKHGAQDKILARRSVNNLSFETSYHEYKNTDDPAWFERTKTYSAPERDIVITDGAKGHNDVVLSTVKGSDRYNWDSSTNTPLNDSDYSFDSLTVYMSEYDAVKVKTTVNNEDVWEWSEPYLHMSTDPNNPYIDYTDVEIWTRAEGEAEFKLYKTLKYDDFSQTTDNELTLTKDEREVYGVVNSTVALPDKTVGYQIKHKSRFYTSKLFVTADMQLKSSNKVLTNVRKDVADGYNSLIKNNCTLQVNNGTLDNSKDTETGGASICAYELSIGNSYICADNRCKAVSGEIVGNYEEFPALICGWGYTDTEDSVKLIESGEFNDLLPYNFTVDRDSIFVKPIFGNIDNKTYMTVKDSDGNDKQIKSIGEYVTVSQYNTKKTETEFYLNGTTYDSTPFNSAYWSVNFTENWEGSGRTMMTINVNTPDGIEATGYYVFYMMKTTLSNISANGPTQTNYVSFTDTTENQSVPLAKESSISGIDKKFQPCYTSIDNKYTAYSSASTNMVPPSQTVTGISSAVKTDGELETKNITVALDSDYVYNVVHSNNTSASNIVIYDVLVNSLNGQTYEWNGTFNSFDISSLTSTELASDTASKALMAPVVYYCIKDSDLIESDLDITKTDIWTTSVPADKSTIKAIAVDCRKDANGNDYVLPAKKSISFNINMHSPESQQTNDVYTFNEAHVFGTINNKDYNNTSLTRVMLHYANPEFSKTSFPESGTVSSRTGVVNKSVINYNLAITNTDDSVAVKNVVVEDLLDANLKLNNMPKVQFDTEEPVFINKVPASSVTYEVSESGGRTKFTATISSIASGHTITLIVPATVNAALDAPIDNTAYITSANSRTVNIPSETTYHYVTVTQAKIKKVNSKGEGLENAQLQIYENNSTNFDSETGKIRDGATPKTVTIGGSDVTQFASTNDVLIFNLEPGDYVLHEVDDREGAKLNIPLQNGYKPAGDIPFTIDIEGITHVKGESVNYVEMVDEPDYKIVFHENKPDNINKEFKTIEPKDLENSKIKHFYDIPDWAEDKYVFAGWYHSSTWEMYDTAGKINQFVTVASNFDSDTFTKANSKSNDENGTYHLYAKWIEVGNIAKDDDDANLVEGGYSGFGIAGVQLRPETVQKLNEETGEYENVPVYDPYDRPGSEYSQSGKRTPGGLRFITSFSQSLYNQIDALSGNKVDGKVPVEYGYVVATEQNIKLFSGNYGVTEPSRYAIQYNGRNVNGDDTTGLDANNKRFKTDANGNILTDEKGNKILARDDLTADNDFAYVKNINCTSKQDGVTNGVVSADHKNFDDYRLYTLVVTYEGNSSSKKGDMIAARAYIRYYDANGKLRVFYNTYKKSMYSGCMCSFNQISAMALPQQAEESGNNE